MFFGKPETKGSATRPPPPSVPRQHQCPFSLKAAFVRHQRQSRFDVRPLTEGVTCCLAQARGGQLLNGDIFFKEGEAGMGPSIKGSL